MTDLDPRAYYDEFGDGEWARLDRDPVTRMEFEGTVAALERDLPATGRVLDAGGAAGRYAAWLADRGHDADLLDLSRRQTELARERAATGERAGSVTVAQGDLRALPYPDDAFDAICCLGGPLSHVIDADERATAAAELRRVATPGAPVFVSVIGRLGMLRDIVKHGLADSHGLLAPIARDGDYTAERVAEHADGEGWAACHGFRVDELEAELTDAGLTVERVLGLENVAHRMNAALADAPDEAVADVRAVVERLREDRAAADVSEHILAVCRG